MSDYLYFSSNLNDIIDHMLDYIVSCKIFLQSKLTASKENITYNYLFPFTAAFCL